MGDELPASKLARGTAEHLLAGIDIFKTSVGEATKRLGEPTRVRETYPATEKIAGDREYVWEKPGVTVELRTEFFRSSELQKSDGEFTSVITVTGTNGAVGRTGRGLKLGDPINAIARIYGNRFDRTYDGVSDLIEIEWKPGTSIIVRWNDKGLINEIDLFAPE
ncbi:MAG: hypothetical protein ABSC48_06430 [Terracidiphilus sp.]